MYSILCSCMSTRVPTFCSKSAFLYLNRPGICCNQRYSSYDTHYDTLELKRNCTPKEVRSAFIRLSKEYHPDKNPNDPLLHAKFVKLNEAYSTLNDINSRRDYDSTLNYKVAKSRIYKQKAPDATYHSSERPESWKEYYDFEAEMKRNESIHVPKFLYKIAKLSRTAVVLILVAIALGALTLQIGAVQFSKSLPKELMSTKEMEISRNLMNARNDAQKYDLQGNIERFAKRVQESKNGRTDL